MEKLKYHRTLSFYFSSQPLFFDGDLQKKPNIRKCIELPYQQTKSELWDEVTDTLCNLDFIQAKAVAKMTYDLVRDFNDVLEVIPDNSENIKQEKARQERMDKYTRDLISFAKGEIEIDELEIPESITPWSQEKIDAEIERIKTDPTRLDRLKDFMNFLGEEAATVQNYAFEFPYFTTQQAWNYAANGPVSSMAGIRSSDIYNYLLLRDKSRCKAWNPLPLALKTLREHTGMVHAVSITPDGQRAISGSQDGTCILWNLKTGKPELILRGHKSRIQTVSITPDGQTAISGSTDKTCILWDLKTGQALQRFKENSGWISSVSITSDGKLAILGISLTNVDTGINSDKKRNCIILDLETGNAIQTLPGHEGDVLFVSITPNGKRAVSSSYDITYIIWDLTTGQALQTLTGYKSFNRAISITPDGRRAISNSHDNSCILWDLETGKELKTLFGHKSPVNAVSITPDGKKAFSGSSDNTCIFWDLEVGTVLKTFKGHTGCINSVSITASGQRAISASKDNSCIIWDIEMGKELEIIMNNNSEIIAISITPQGHRVISGPDTSLPNFGEHNCKLWDLKTGQMLKILSGHTSKVNSISITPDGQRAISCSNDHTCILWDLYTGKALHTLKSEIFGPVDAVSILVNGQRAISAHGTICILWDLEINRTLRELIGHKQSVRTICFTPDGKRAITGSSDETCILWDPGTGQALLKFKGHNDPIHTISITPDGQRLISGSNDKTCIVWDIRTGHTIQTLKGHTGSIITVLASPDGQRVISSSNDKTCIIWDLSTGNRLACFTSDSPISALKICMNTISIGHSSGRAEILDSNKNLLCPCTAITTVWQVWNNNPVKNQKFLADCPLCGHCFNPQYSILAAIFSITKKAGLKLEQSPCLELPDEAWEDPGLLGNCPKCGAELKFNPFIAGGD